MPKVKICGITNAQDAKWAANLGADFIGLNFYSGSPRKVSDKQAQRLISELPPFVTAVGLFVNEPADQIKKVAHKIGLKMIQLHGDEVAQDVDVLKASGLVVIKAIRLQGPLSQIDLSPLVDRVDYFLFDSHSDLEAGGTGQTFNWEWLAGVDALPKPWFLAGGLSPENIEEAIKMAHPPYVDVCSGVERTKTRKDYELMKTFIQKVKSKR